MEFFQYSSSPSLATRVWESVLFVPLWLGCLGMMLSFWRKRSVMSSL
jgi:hypothetical protein